MAAKKRVKSKSKNTATLKKKASTKKLKTNKNQRKQLEALEKSGH